MKGYVSLMLTDVVMPGMNGRELGKRAHQMRPGLRVLYMTGYSRNAVVHHSRLDEGLKLIEKPITQSQLATRSRDLLDETVAWMRPGLRRRFVSVRRIEGAPVRVSGRHAGRLNAREQRTW